MRTIIFLVTAAFLASCSGTGSAPSEGEQPAAPEPTEVAENQATAPTDNAEAAARPEGSEPATEDSKHYGQPFTLTDVVSADRLLADPAAFAANPILVEGEVVDVCQKAGCWMVMSDGTQTIRVVMKDHGFAVAKDGAGSKAKVEGSLINREPDAERTAHLEGESLRPDLVPEKAGQRWELVATSVTFAGS